MTTEKPKSRNQLDGDIVKVAQGIAIYKTLATPFWQARIRNPATKKYVVRSTKTASQISARQLAVELAKELMHGKAETPADCTFNYFANRFVRNSDVQVKAGERNANYVRTSKLFLDHDEWGLLQHFGKGDVRKLKTREWQQYMENVRSKRPDLSGSTRNMLTATFRNVMKIARYDGLIDAIPDTPRVKESDNPRSFFRFAPLVSTEECEYAALLRTAKKWLLTRSLCGGTS